MTAGRYKIQYALSQYYTIRNQDCFYPVVEVIHIILKLIVLNK